jgi:DNA adenine methylase
LLVAALSSDTPGMNSPFAWPGGKRCLKKTLLSLIPPHTIYVEVFAGSAKLLFAKEPSPREVMNDLNAELTNFFRVAKHRPAELAERFETELVHAGRFRELRGAPSDDELQDALRFAYLVWYSYGAKGEHFASASAKTLLGGKVRRSLDLVRELLQLTSARLRNVLIEQRDFAEILARYDSAETFFYLDPPYVHFQANGRYTALAEDRREQLFTLLAGLKGKFLMSFDDCAEVRELSRRHGFKVRGVEVSYTLSQKKTKPVREVLITK